MNPPAVPGRTLRHLLAWVLRRRRRYRVVGSSMLPALAPGQTVLVEPGAPVSEGDIVVLLHPNRPDFVLIKRVESSNTDGLWVIGDNPSESTDSRDFGRIQPHRVLGRVVCRFR